ncbi:hypothetical protein A7C99_3270 [Trichophyton rubrum]|uniref:Uncharacterized protein n=1 Tax=Trichophyton rubrum TaxID=5551 RepID=A0A178F1Y6_TRIRU|nr:hypothetical protein A7C99_3270 [Trichophyton rubrum]
MVPSTVIGPDKAQCSTASAAVSDSNHHLDQHDEDPDEPRKKTAKRKGRLDPQRLRRAGNSVGRPSSSTVVDLVAGCPISSTVRPPMYSFVYPAISSSAGSDYKPAMPCHAVLRRQPPRQQHLLADQPAAFPPPPAGQLTSPAVNKQQDELVVPWLAAAARAPSGPTWPSSCSSR